MGKSKKVIIVKKLKTTFDKWMADPEIKERFDKEYKDFVLSEVILAMMANINTFRNFPPPSVLPDKR